MATGRVIRAISGFFDVNDGEVTRRCRARGVFKKQGVTVLVGDIVEYEPMGSQEGVVVSVHPRSSELVRPPIANTDHALVVFSFVTPDLTPLMLDKTITSVLIAGVKPSIVFTKADLAEPSFVEAVSSLYRKCGFQTLAISAKQGEGVEQVRTLMQGRINVFAGPSGAGKSTLANAVAPGLKLQMGAVSEKIGRGRQTTRHVELFQLDHETWLADAPGFSQLQLSVPARELGTFFPEFQKVNCAYRGCSHLDEEGCAVRASVERGEIAQSRYDSYQQMYHEIREREENMY
ncbi:ribosome small subunit-dependent GTPase A [Alicyclobacillus dauci]|uniref:Small ribosomal subunit biogenesis GTPase RsgA n=1 Tax=Alicyclobacillus dauci TaxID=1475485 RepID=A0ABY6YY39_9BACL|nr:ribosome small subunit-dependent GTPase A [Alicyclobacillus dauci]WAH35492.1 ribosome small subunit-dependent GTPase A [Alicyclobacillus dauci]